VGTTSHDSTVKVWTFSEDILSPLLALTGHKGRTTGLDFSPDGERLVSGSIADGTVRVWDISPGGGVEPILFPHGNAINTAVVFHPGGTRLATASADVAQIWDIATGESLHTLSSDDEIWMVAYSPDGALLATADKVATVKLWDAESGQEISTLTGLPQQENRFFQGVPAAVFSPDGTWLATAGGDGAVRIWDVPSLQEGDLGVGDELFLLQEPAGLNWSVDVSFSPDGHWIAASINTYLDEFYTELEGDGVVKVWDAGTRELMWTLGVGDGVNPVYVAFSPAGDRLAAGHMTEGRVTVWALPDDPAGTPEELFRAAAGKAYVGSLNFSPDGSQLAVPYSEGMGIWDAETGEFIKALPHSFMVLEAVYSPDGEQVLTAGFDGYGRLFILDVDELIALAESRLTRTLTDEECQEYLHVTQCP
jgi:WD40 repeat protein